MIRLGRKGGKTNNIEERGHDETEHEEAEHCHHHDHCHGHDGAEEVAACGCCGKGGCGCCHGEKSERKKYLDIAILVVGFLSLVASFVISEIDSLHDTVWRYIDFGIIAVLLCGVPIALNAFKVLFTGRGMGRITADLLITVSMLACILLQILIWTGALEVDGHTHSYIFAAGEVAFLMMLGELIEDFTVGKARAGIEGLVSLTPKTAMVREGDTLVKKGLDEVKVGDIVEVYPGDTISVDGEITAGVTAVDESVMTGESVPVDKKSGDLVYGGTMNLNGHIVVRVTKACDDMAVSKLKKLVEEAEGKKAPIAMVADRAAKFIVPSAILLCIVIFILNYFWLSRGDILSSVVRGVTMLVVFCPCALALSTPTAVAAALGNATKKGVLIKSGGAIEALSYVKTVAFDKTGTLTEGKLSINAVIAYGVSEAELLRLAGACESGSRHPIAGAIYTYCDSKVTLPKAENVKEQQGSGVFAEVEGVRIGVVKWSEAEEHAAKELTEKANELLSEGNTVTAVMRQGEVIGLFALSDTVRQNARECVEALHEMGISTAMLTGDNGAAARRVAVKTGVKKVYSSLMPEDKLRIISELKQDGSVCMVGDGVNDAPALAAADSSVAMGALGSEVAIETASVSLLSSELKRIPQLLRLARKMMSKIKLNITISMTINVLAVFLSAIGWLTPVTGALVHNISSVLVVCNSALLLLFEKTKS